MLIETRSFARAADLLRRRPTRIARGAGMRISAACLRRGLPALLAMTLAHAQSVTVEETAEAFTLANGTIVARVSKRTGDLTSMQHRGVEMLTDKSGHAGAYWSHDATGGTKTIARVTIDPKANAGERGEVSVKGISGGRRMGHGPGVAKGAEGDLAVDIEIRYALGRGESGVYTYCTFEHPADYPAGTFTEARFAAKLADMFDWMTVDAKRDKYFPATLHEGDKYIYTAVQSENPVFGWSSTTKQTGFWLINPSVEYLSGGPTKVEFLCHRDTTPVAAPIVLNYWRSSHYGGAVVEIGQGERWSKVIGPFFLYVNRGGDPKTLAQEARAQGAKEAAKWPYEWVAGVDYPRRAQRSTVKGQFVLNDPLAAATTLPNLRVGMTVAAYASPVPPANPNSPARQIDWQTDAKHYQFWTRGDEQGRFAIPNVRPGRYALRAFADGVLGEFLRGDVTVEVGKPLNLGRVEWTPVRRGKPLWEIGIANRNGSEFFKGGEFYDPEMPLKYARLFPDDVKYVIGQSDIRRDWFFQHVPHNEDPNAKSQPYFGIRAAGRPTPYAVMFDVAAPCRGRATLRLAICGGGAREIEVMLNDQSVGKVDRLLIDGAITRHTIQGLWYEREVVFDAALLQPGRNTLKLIVPAGPVNNGVIYDYLRLEWDEAARARIAGE